MHDELHSLDIDVYEQDRFEKGILNQVDSALTNAESNFKKTITRKQIAQLQDEKRWALGHCQKLEILLLSYELRFDQGML